MKKKIIKEFALALALALLWFVSGYVVMGVLAPAWSIQCGLINGVMGMILLLLATRTQEGTELFYEGPRNGGSIIVALLWSLPLILLLWGTIGWILRLLGYWRF